MTKRAIVSSDEQLRAFGAALGELAAGGALGVTHVDIHTEPQADEFTVEMGVIAFATDPDENDGGEPRQ